MRGASTTPPRVESTRTVPATPLTPRVRTSNVTVCFSPASVHPAAMLLSRPAVGDEHSHSRSRRSAMMSSPHMPKCANRGFCLNSRDLLANLAGYPLWAKLVCFGPRYP